MTFSEFEVHLNKKICKTSREQELLNLEDMDVSVPPEISTVSVTLFCDLGKQNTRLCCNAVRTEALFSGEK